MYGVYVVWCLGVWYVCGVLCVCTVCGSVWYVGVCGMWECVMCVGGVYFLRNFIFLKFFDFFLVAIFLFSGSSLSCSMCTYLYEERCTFLNSVDINYKQL